MRREPSRTGPASLFSFVEQRRARDGALIAQNSTVSSPNTVVVNTTPLILKHVETQFDLAIKSWPLSSAQPVHEERDDDRVREVDEEGADKRDHQEGPRCRTEPHHKR